MHRNAVPVLFLTTRTTFWSSFTREARHFCSFLHPYFADFIMSCLRLVSRTFGVG